MNKKIVILFALLSLALISWQWTKDESPSNRLEEALPHASYGLTVYDATLDKVLLNDAGDKYFIPASLTKLFTAERAIKKFGVDHRFVTELFITGTIEDAI
ncbi:MAG: D-alanyl-D-alanine carboxypeptidase, partial [Parachlamydiaceae bacterium]